MAKFLGILILVLIFGTIGGYYYYTLTGYKFGLDETILFQNTIKINSSDFIYGGQIPIKFTCDGENISPKFTISQIPKDSQSLAVILEDANTKPDPFTHWLVFNINPNLTTIDSTTIWQNGKVGQNDLGEADYNGPCPPKGQTHRYYFRVYALNSLVETQTLSRYLFDKFVAAHTISSDFIAGVYSKVP